MNPIPYTLSNDFIALTINNKPFVIMSSDNRFNTVKEFIKARDWEAVERSVDLPKAIEKFSVGNVKVYAGTITYKNATLHSVLVDKILSFAREGYPFEPFARFLDKLMANPSDNSRNALYQYIELFRLPITDDGDFIACKSVRNDFLDHYSGTVDNTPGKVVTIDRSLVDDDINKTCSYGLHVGPDSYVKSFNSGKAILVKVNPTDVCSLPRDTSHHKMRVCRYEVLAEIESNNSETKPFESDIAVNNSYYQAATTQPAPDLEAPIVTEEISYDGNLVDTLPIDYPQTPKIASKRDSKGRFAKAGFKPAKKPKSTAKGPKRDSKGRFI